MNSKILVLFSHPRFERSVNNQAMIKHLPKIPEITFHDLYERYPDFNIDLEYEKELLNDHGIIIWMHPFYWYSSPPLLKQWIDIVLEFGWAYGPGGNALQGKMAFNAITTGGQQAAYSREGHNRFTIAELLAPFHQTANLCKMIYLPPFIVYGTHRITKENLEDHGKQFEKLLLRLAGGDFSADEMKKFPDMNDWLKSIR